MDAETLKRIEAVQKALEGLTTSEIARILKACLILNGRQDPVFGAAPQPPEYVSI